MGQKKVIIDTNVLISALGWGGTPYKIVDLGFSGVFRWIISKPIFQELLTALNYDKLDFISKEEKMEFISAVSETAEFIEISKKFKLHFVDPDDVMFLECALEADADYLVTGNKHLLMLGKMGKTRIVTPARFLSILRR